MKSHQIDQKQRQNSEPVVFQKIDIVKDKKKKKKEWAPVGGQRSLKRHNKQTESVFLDRIMDGGKVGECYKGRYQNN